MMLDEPRIAGTWLVKRESYELMVCLHPDGHYWMADNATKSITIGTWSFELREISPLLVFAPSKSDIRSEAAGCYFSRSPKVEVWELLAHNADESITLRSGTMSLMEWEVAQAQANEPSASAAGFPRGPRVPNLPSADPSTVAAPAVDRPSIRTRTVEDSNSAKLKAIYADITKTDSDFYSEWKSKFAEQYQNERDAAAEVMKKTSEAISAGSKLRTEAAYADGRNGYSMVHPPRR